jgi:hypothetical protein
MIPVSFGEVWATRELFIVSRLKTKKNSILTGRLEIPGLKTGIRTLVTVNSNKCIKGILRKIIFFRKFWQGIPFVN